MKNREIVRSSTSENNAEIEARSNTITIRQSPGYANESLDHQISPKIPIKLSASNQFNQQFRLIH
jgi:hypothetical protein